MHAFPDQASELQSADGLPEGLARETESDFCFLCERPRRLVVPQQIKGQHKIWPLPAALAKQFAPALKPVPQVFLYPLSQTFSFTPSPDGVFTFPWPTIDAAAYRGLHVNS